jgi:hypothetical protein
MPAAILARLVLLEARRSGLPWLVAGGLPAALGLAAFLSQVAVTEGHALQLAVLAALLRAGAVFLVAGQVAASTMREMNDKGLELSLSFPLARSTQYVGRLAGFVTLGALLAVASALPLLLFAPPAAVAQWGLSLACEVALVAAAALFFSMTLAQVVPAIAATAGLYLLARSMAAIQAIAAGPLVEASLPSRIAHAAVDGVALLLPRLDLVTRTEWLVYGTADASTVGRAVGGMALYALLVVAAGLFDFHRRNS